MGIVVFAEESPPVASPNERVSGRPRKAMVKASPELTVSRLVSTATGGSPFFRK